MGDEGSIAGTLRDSTGTVRWALLSPYQFQARRTHNLLYMKREVSNSILSAFYAHVRVWRDQRAQRRQSLRQSRLMMRAARRLQRDRFLA
jgi:hypothetical protein